MSVPDTAASAASPASPARAARHPGLSGRRVVPRILDDLREQIVSVRLRPGAALSEQRIAEGYGVSRTPVREAFRALAAEGFLEIVPQVGSFVARIDLRAVRDNHFVRETLECRIVALAAERVDARRRLELKRNLAEQAAALAAGDADEFFRADEAMHRLLAASAGHESAWQVIHGAKSQLDRVRHLSLADAGRSRRRLREHRAVVERVLAGDARGASEAMRAHLGSIFDTIEAIAVDHAELFVGLDDGAPPLKPPNR